MYKFVNNKHTYTTFNTKNNNTTTNDANMYSQKIRSIFYVSTLLVLVSKCLCDQVKDEQIKIFKKYVLEKLDMTEEPKTAENYVLPRSLMKRQAEIPTNIAGSDSDSYQANAILQSEKIGTNTYKFDFDNLKLKGLEAIHSAKLTIFDVKKLSYGTSIRVINIKDTSKTEVANIPISMGDDATSADITKHITEWVDTIKPKDIYRLKFKCDKKQCFDSKMMPIIEIDYSTKYSRVRRKTRKCRGNKCCLRQISVTTKDLNWHNWFIAPQNLNIYYCSGSCKNQPKSFYGQLVELANPGKSSSPCCMPTRLKDFNIMHLTDNHTAYVKRLENMMVTDCECA